MKIALVLPHQLFEKSEILNGAEKAVVVEHPHFFTAFKYHKQKLVLHRASMQWYADLLISKGIPVDYVPFSTPLDDAFKLISDDVGHLEIVMYDPIEKTVIRDIKALAAKYKCGLTIVDTPMLMTQRAILEKTFAQKKSYRMAAFYQQQRKRFGILLTHHGDPVGGKWSFDEDNRSALPKGIIIPPLQMPDNTAYVKSALAYIEKHFSSNPGVAESFMYPISHDEARAVLKEFVHKRLGHFGPYQDAMSATQPFIFHSLLSSSLNNGLITPHEVIDAVLAYASSNHVSLSSVEGFVRQIIGWREFVAGLYMTHDDTMRSKNFWEHTKKLSSAWYTAKTGLLPVDIVIKRVMKYAYAHHIERLMVLGNAMLLCQTDPNDVYRWFMELFIDAYDWVMVPNVYGMSQFADGGMLASKPYISGSNYINKMSDFAAGEWEDTWNGLYWHFIDRHKNYFAKNQRASFTVTTLNRMNPEKRNLYAKRAEAFLKSL